MGVLGLLLPGGQAAFKAAPVQPHSDIAELGGGVDGPELDGRHVAQPHPGLRLISQDQRQLAGENRAIRPLHPVAEHQGEQAIGGGVAQGLLVLELVGPAAALLKLLILGNPQAKQTPGAPLQAGEQGPIVLFPGVEDSMSELRAEDLFPGIHPQGHAELKIELQAGAHQHRPIW